MNDIQLFIRSNGPGRPPDPAIKPAVREAVRRLGASSTPEAVSREVFVLLGRKVHWITARKYLDELATERVLTKRSLTLGKKTILYYDPVRDF